MVKTIKAKKKDGSKTKKKSGPKKAIAPKLGGKPDYSKGVLDGIIDAVGDGEAQLLGSDGLAIKIKGVISTQCATIDAAIGRGGVPRSRLTIIHGAEGRGKTTLALHLVAETQRMGGVAVYLDKEYKLDPDYAAKVGVDTDRLVVAQPAYLEKAFRTFDGIIDRAAAMREQGANVPILIVLDSMNAAITKAQYEGEWDDQFYAPQARVFSALLPKLMPKVSKEDVALVFISQVRKKMNVMFGDDSDIAGGNAPKFYASLIMDVGRRAATNEDGEKVGNKIEVHCKKNQIAPPFKKAQCEIVYGKGINKEAALIIQAEKHGFVEKSGAWYSYKGDKLGQGLSASAKRLVEDANTTKRLLKLIEKKNGWERNG